MVYALHREIAEAKTAFILLLTFLWNARSKWLRLKLPDGEYLDLLAAQIVQHRVSWPLDYFPEVSAAADADSAAVS